MVNFLLRTVETVYANLHSGAPSLLLRHTPTHGLHVHISRPVRDTVKLNKARSFAAIVTNKTTKIYVNEVSHSEINSGQLYLIIF